MRYAIELHWIQRDNDGKTLMGERTHVITLANRHAVNRVKNFIIGCQFLESLNLYDDDVLEFDEELDYD